MLLTSLPHQGKLSGGSMVHHTPRPTQPRNGSGYCLRSQPCVTQAVAQSGQWFPSFNCSGPLFTFIWEIMPGTQHITRVSLPGRDGGRVARHDDSRAEAAHEKRTKTRCA